MWRPGILIADVAGCTDKSSEMRIRISARRNCENARVMGKRIRNYRAGDRAEDLGIFLLKAFCAVAPIPRQEDFGLADAVATLLRAEGRFWYAEDSFLVQFKSRTEKNLTLKGPVLCGGSPRISPSFLVAWTS